MEHEKEKGNRGITQQREKRKKRGKKKERKKEREIGKLKVMVSLN